MSVEPSSAALQRGGPCMRLVSFTLLVATRRARGRGRPMSLTMRPVEAPGFSPVKSSPTGPPALAAAGAKARPIFSPMFAGLKPGASTVKPGKSSTLLAFTTH
jgi:hypothetical protein